MDDDVRIARLEPSRDARAAPRRAAPRRETRCGAMGTRERDIRTVDRSTRWNEGGKEETTRAGVCGEDASPNEDGETRETRATRVWARGGADRSNDRSIHHRHRICTFATSARSRAIGVSRERQNSPRRSLLRPHVERHQFRERLGLAQSREFGGVRLFRLTNGKHRPRERGDLHASSSPSSVSLALTHDTSSRIIRPIARVSPIFAPSRPIRIHPFLGPPSRGRRLHARVFATPPPTHHIASHPPSLARTKHIINTLGPYSQSDSPGGASTLYTIPSVSYTHLTLPTKA